MSRQRSLLAVGLVAFLVVGAGIAAKAAEGVAAAGDAAAGEELFLDRCVTCHIAEGGGQGPSLSGVFGRKAGVQPDFAYSAAIRASGLTWTGPELDRFLANPVKAIPGTAMPITVPDAKERADLVAYFASKRTP